MNSLNQYKFEQGPIRPPSEAYSLLIRVTRNCPWNKCLFCGVYKGLKFELRTAEEVIEDIKKVGSIKEEMKTIAWKSGFGGDLRKIAASIYNDPQYDWSIRNVALWIWSGSRSVFLQDANSLIMPARELVMVLSFLKDRFPEIDRITTYARSKTAAQKKLEDLISIKNAGLTRVHVGFESGSDKVLEFVQKGVTSEEHIEGGIKLMQAGLELSEYFIPGLGGKKWSVENAVESARVLNNIDPNYIRIRSMMISPKHLLWEKIQSGEYEPQNDDEIVDELELFINELDVTSYLVSDHIANLLPEIEGKFPGAKAHCLEVIKRYKSLSELDKNNYKLGRRMGIYNSLDDLNNMAIRSEVDSALVRIGCDESLKLEEIISELKMSMAL